MKIHRIFLSLCVCTIWTLPAQGTEIISQQNEENNKPKKGETFRFTRADIDRLYAEYKAGKFDTKLENKKAASMRIAGHYGDNEDGDESKLLQQQENKK